MWKSQARCGGHYLSACESELCKEVGWADQSVRKQHTCTIFTLVLSFLSFCSDSPAMMDCNLEIQIAIHLFFSCLSFDVYYRNRIKLEHGVIRKQISRFCYFHSWFFKQKHNKLSMGKCSSDATGYKRLGLWLLFAHKCPHIMFIRMIFTEYAQAHMHTHTLAVFMLKFPWVRTILD